LRPELATLADAASLAMTKISAATAAWLSGVAEAEAEIEMVEDDILGVFIDALAEIGGDETAENDTTDEKVVATTDPEADPDGIEPEVKVTKVDSAEVLGATVPAERLIIIDDKCTETEAEAVNECVEVTNVVVTPTELGIGVESGG
jgi:hypothetical protein